MKKIGILLIVLVAIVVVARSGLFTGGASISKIFGTEPSIEETIAKVVEGGNGVRSKLLRKHGQTFKDYRVYKATDGRGVVFEYVLRNEVDPEKMSLSADPAKTQFMSVMRKSKNWSKTKLVLKKGIYFHILYKGPEGDNVMEFKVTSSDV